MAAISTTYQKAGVNIATGDDLVDWLKKSAKSKDVGSSSVIAGVGGFAALFRARFAHMQSPVLVSSTDGVGTKVKLASDFKRFDGIGQDLVAMCVNDLACVGGEPLFFLDYYACGRLDLKSAKSFLLSVRKACDEVGCVLIGGETAEMPGIYKKGDFDCAGFAVGVVDESQILGAHRVQAGDRLIGVASSGFHSNGYSLLRKIFARDLKKWADVLLRPTFLYSPLINHLKKQTPSNLHAVAHVTGGGLDNLLRVIPDGTALELNGWPVPEEFLIAKKRAKMNWPEILRVLNCGVGLVLFVSKSKFEGMQMQVEAKGFRTFDLGEVVNARKKAWHLRGGMLNG